MGVGKFSAAASIRSFFEEAGLFENCPWRPAFAELDAYDDASAEGIMAHMVGHLLDYRAGHEHDMGSGQIVKAIEQHDIEEELKRIYNDCNNAELCEARQLDPTVGPDKHPGYSGFGPEQRGCWGADAQAELMAEAIRAYMRDPNYMKTVAPKTAARIRAAVNSHPDVSQTIQFN